MNSLRKDSRTAYICRKAIKKKRQNGKGRREGEGKCAYCMCEMQRGCLKVNEAASFDDYQPNKYAKNKGATIVASDSMTNFGVSTFSFPQVIFSFGTAPEYEQ